MHPMLHYCVIGFPIKHSLSPKLHTEAFKKLGVDACYEAVEVSPEDLAVFMGGFRKKYAGANVTIPHKEKVQQFLDRVDPDAAAIGAVNMIVNRDGVLIGYNTDVHGALHALEEARMTPLKNKRVSVLGAGGAARAVVYGLTKVGAEVSILNRTLDRARKLAEDFSCNALPLAEFKACPAELVINTTSVGMVRETAQAKAHGQANFTDTLLPDFAHLIAEWKTKPCVMDIVYRPLMTKLLRDAKDAGCPIITGDNMFLAQAAASFELWTSKQFPETSLTDINGNYQ